MAQTINTLEDLAEKLASCNFHDRKAVEPLLNRLKLNTKNIAKKCTWDNDKYTRNVAYRDENFEVLLLCWKPGHSSPIHDHSGSSCWMAVLQGEAQEEIYSYELKNKKITNVELEKSHSLSAPGFVYIDDKIGIHKVTNIGSEDMITLHIYATPIGQCYRYSPDQNETNTAKFRNDYQVPLSVDQ